MNLSSGKGSKFGKQEVTWLRIRREVVTSKAFAAFATKQTPAKNLPHYINTHMYKIQIIISVAATYRPKNLTVRSYHFKNSSFFRLVAFKFAFALRKHCFIITPAKTQMNHTFSKHWWQDQGSKKVKGKIVWEDYAFSYPSSSLTFFLYFYITSYYLKVPIDWQVCKLLCYLYLILDCSKKVSRVLNQHLPLG